MRELEEAGRGLYMFVREKPAADFNGPSKYYGPVKGTHLQSTFSSPRLRLERLLVYASVLDYLLSTL